MLVVVKSIGTEIAVKADIGRHTGQSGVGECVDPSKEIARQQFDPAVERQAGGKHGCVVAEGVEGVEAAVTDRPN